MASKKGGIVKKGHEEGMELILSILKEFGLPLGILPVVDVVEAGFIRETGYAWILQKKKIEHKFKLADKLVSYDVEITANVGPRSLRKAKGVKVKQFLLWPTVHEINVDEAPAGQIHIKSLAGVTMSFPVEYFAAGQ